MGVLVQVIAAILLSFSCMNMGISLAFPSSTVLLFKSENTTLQRSMTNVEIALLGSLPPFGTMIAQPLVVGYILNRLGRKRTAMLASSFLVISWIIITIAKRVEAILIAMFIAGWGSTMSLEIAIYISEISQDSIRGTLTSGAGLACNLGFLTSYFLGGALEHHTMVYTCLFLSVIGLFMIVPLKESPVSLMLKAREEAAAKSLAFYRRTRNTSREVTIELNNIRRSINSDVEDAQSLTQVKESTKPALTIKKMSCWQLFKTTPSIRRQFYLVIVLKTAFVLQGLPMVLIYAEPMFAATVGDTISPNLCSVMLGFVMLITGIVAAYFTDKIGRRPLQIHSSIVTGFCCMVLGTQILTEWFPKWTVPLLVCIFAISHTFGSGTVPFIVAAEIFLPEVKNTLLVLTVEWLLICQFSVLFIFNILVPVIGLYSIFYFFSFVCFTTTAYFFYFLPETKGLPVYTIQALFMEK